MCPLVQLAEGIFWVGLTVMAVALFLRAMEKIAEIRKKTPVE